MGLPNPSRKTEFSGANGDRGKIIFPVQLTTMTSRISNHTRLILLLLYIYIMTMTNIHLQYYLMCMTIICSTTSRLHDLEDMVLQARSGSSAGNIYVISLEVL